MAPPQCQVERHKDFMNEKQFEWADFQVRWEPMPWTEVGQMNTKVVARNKLTTSNAGKLEPAATSQPTEQQASDHMVEGKGRIRGTLSSAHGNRTTSKWKRKLGNRSKRKQINSTM